MATGGAVGGGKGDEGVDTDSCILRVLGVTPSMGLQDLELVFESERKSGGGELKALEMNTAREEALLIYKSLKVAQRVLSRGSVDFFGTTLLITQYVKPSSWDGKTVYITGVTSSMNSEHLELIYESKKKSGGGPVQSLTVETDCNTAYVTFEDAQDAENVLQREIVYLEKEDIILYAQRPDHVDHTVHPDMKTVRVSGIPSHMPDEVLQLLFESRKATGGGSVESVNVDRRTRTADIRFEAIEDAERVIRKKSVTWKDNTLDVSACGQTPSLCAETKSGVDTGLSKSTETSDASTHCLAVMGIRATTSVDHVRMFFENRKSSGGGDIDEMMCNTDIGLAVITFKDNNVVTNVLKCHSKKPLTLSEARLNISSVPLTYFGNSLENIKSRCVTVTDLPDSATEEGLTIWFENARVTGGGKLENCYLNSLDNRAVLTYRSVSVAENVVSKCERQGLKYESQRVCVRRLQPRSLPPIAVEQCEQDKLCLKNVPTSCSVDDIKAYFKAIKNCSVESVTFGHEPGLVLVTFSRIPDLGTLYQAVCQKHLQENMLEIICVKQSQSVEVYGIGGLSEQKLLVYFEHPTSQGGPVLAIDILPEREQCAIVTFVNRKDAISVVNKQTHYYDKKTLRTPNLHYECMGVVSAAVTTASHMPRQNFLLPDDIVLDSLDQNLVKFLCSRSQVKDEINEAMASVNTQVDWPTAKSATAEVTLKCSLKREMKDFQEKVNVWAPITRDAFKLAVGSQFCVQCFSPPDNKVPPWREFVEKISALLHATTSPADGGDCDVKYRNGERKVLIVGRKKCVTEMVAKIQEVCNKMVVQSVTRQECIRNLKPHQLRLLLTHSFSEHVTRSYGHHVTVQIDPKRNLVTISGPQANIDKVKVEMYETVNSAETETFVHSPIMCELLSTDQMREKLYQAFRERGIKVHMDVNVKTGVQLYSTSPVEIQRGQQVIEELTEEVTVPLEAGSDQVLTTHEWISLTEYLYNQHPGLLMIGVLLDKNTVVIAASRDIIKQAQRKVEQFLSENTMLVSLVPMEMPYVQYIMRHKKEEVKVFKGKRQTLQLKTIRQQHQTGFSVTGNTKDQREAQAFLNAIKSELMKKTFIPDQKTIGTFFEEDNGQSVLRSLEEKHEVIIDLNNAGDSSARMWRKATATLRNGKVIYVVLGDITKYTGDVIVNAASKSMNHGGGIAKAIVDKGGKSIQDESYKYVAKHGEVPTGEACVSESGFLPCKKVVHTVGPIWKGGRNNEHVLLSRAIATPLDICTKFGFSSIAFPAVSAGIYGFPMKDACEIIVRTARDYLVDGATSVDEVTLIDTSGTVTEAFCQALTTLLGRHSVSLTSSTHTSHAAFPDHLTQVDTESVDRPVHRRASFPAARGGSLWISTGSRTEVMTSEGISVKVVGGSLTKLKVDVMVNLTSRELDLQHGAVSKSLLSDAGPSIQRECSQTHPNGIQYGELAKTKGYNLPCQFVYHGACERYGQPNAAKNMKTYIAACLLTANRDGMASIAFPSLGTGSLGFSSANVAQIMYEEVRKFSENNKQPNASLQKVLVVVFADSVRKAFEDELQALLNPKTRQLKKPTSQIRRLASAVSAGVKSLIGKGPPKEPPKKLVFRVTGCSKQEYVIDQVIDKLKDTCKNEITVKKFNSKQDKENIRNLTDDQVEKIKGFESTHHVAVEIDRAPAGGCITVEGRHQHITEVISEIHQIFRDKENQERDAYEREMIGRLAQWQYEDNGEFVDYPSDINARIEKAHSDRKPCARWDEDCSKGTKHMEVDFKRQMECEVNKWQKGKKVRRKTPESVALPTTWTKGGRVKVEVDRTSAEYKQIQTHFYQSMTAFGTQYTKLHKVFRIQNETMYKKYQIHKKSLDDTNKKGVKNERLLWHGTKPTVLDEINTNGFNRSFNTRAWYGKGVYFATEAGLSAQGYTTTDANGHKYIYRARVLTGEYCLGNKTMNVPPPKNPNNPTLKYDAVVDNVQNPREWVVFTDSSAYPEYLFEFH